MSICVIHLETCVLCVSREFEQQREVSDRGLPANTDHVGGKLSTQGEALVSRADKVLQFLACQIEIVGYNVPSNIYKFRHKQRCTPSRNNLRMQNGNNYQCYSQL